MRGGRLPRCCRRHDQRSERPRGTDASTSRKNTLRCSSGMGRKSRWPVCSRSNVKYVSASRELGAAAFCSFENSCGHSARGRRGRRRTARARGAAGRRQQRSTEGSVVHIHRKIRCSVANMQKACSYIPAAALAPLLREPVHCAKPVGVGFRAAPCGVRAGARHSHCVSHSLSESYLGSATLAGFSSGPVA